MKRSLKKVAQYAALVLIAFIALFPLLWAFSASMRSDAELYRYAMPFTIHTLLPVEWTIGSYVSIFTEFHFLQPILNTLLLIVILIPLGCIINSLAAFAFATFQFPLKKILFALFLVSFMIPFESIAMPLYRVVDGFGWVNTRLSMVVPCVASGLILFLFTQFFKDIPKSILEAASIDGAGWLRVFFHIVVPSSIPVFITAGLMVFMDQWNAYLWPLLVARDTSIRTVQIALSTFKMERVTLWSCLYAGALVSASIPLLLFLPFQRFFVQGIVSSGVKG